MSVFYRDIFTVIWLTLSSDEPLGPLDPGFLQDYDGTAGQISLLHIPSGVRYPVPMNEVAPAGPHGQFTGWLSIGSLPDGDYEIQGHARDPLGNTVILGDSGGGIGPDDRVEHLTFTLVDGAGSVIQYGPLFIAGAIEATMSTASLTWIATAGSWASWPASPSLISAMNVPTLAGTMDAPAHSGAGP